MEIPPDVDQQIIASLPDVTITVKRLYDLPGALLPHSEAHVGITSTCLENVAELLQFTRKALYLAKCEWHTHKDRRVEGYPEQTNHLHAVHFSRFYFDHAANCLYATLNHLAAAMWHFHEKEDRPLGDKYKFPDRVCIRWCTKTPTPSSLTLLKSVLDAKSWIMVKGYRDRWTHREVPVIAGEVRRRRRTLWRKIGEAPPPSFLMAHVGESIGEVAYVCYGIGDHEFEMPVLMDAAVESFRLLITASEDFLLSVRQVYQSHGWSFDG